MRNSLFFLLCGLAFGTAPGARADGAPGTVSSDVFDSTQGTVILNHDTIIDPINAFRTIGGFEDGHVLMRNGGLGSVSFIEFQTAGAVSIQGVRLFAANDGAANIFRRALSRFRLLADLDGNGSFETLAVDSDPVNPDYSMQPGNASSDPQILDLALATPGGSVITAQRWRLEVTQGSDIQPFEGARIIEVDALSDLVSSAADAGPGSLRQTIANASPGATITFAPHLAGATITLTSGELLLNKDLTIDASALAGGIGISGDHVSRVLSIPGGVTVTLDSLTLRDGFAEGDWGGGVFNNGTLTVNRCLITGNTAQSYGGGIENNGTLTVSRSTFAGNTGEGGGGIDNNGTLVVSQCTFFDNYVPSNDGSAIWAGGTVAITNCTVVGNSGEFGAAAIAQYGEAPIVVANSIVTLNSNANFHGAYTPAGVNLTSGDPLLFPLGAYGGPTPTLPPMAGSPALDAGSDAVAAGLGTDQRGAPRLVGAHVDIGAVESPLPDLVVTTTADSGSGSLRQAILTANASPGSDTIEFNIPGPGPHVIPQLSGWPEISDPVCLDGTTQPGYAGQPLIELSGAAYAEDTGLVIQTSNSVIAGFAFTDFDAAIVVLGEQSSDNWIYGNYVGLDTFGTNLTPNFLGIHLYAGTHHNVIGTDGDGFNDDAERNVVSGNDYGIYLSDTHTNRIAGNYIGTDTTGTAALGNSDGVFILSSALGNIIGTDSSDDPFNAGERNVISGNGRGLAMSGPNRVAGNFIGTDATGAFAVPNQFGLGISGVGAVIGSDGDGLRDDEERNVISGNSIQGIIMGGPGTCDVVIRGNYIGTDASGTLAVPNESGLDLNNGMSRAQITENVISGNAFFGIIVADGSHSNAITGNLLGVDATGANALGNGDTGVLLVDAPANAIGGTAPGDANVIAHNGAAGVAVLGASSIGNSILGNSIFANAGIGIDLGGDGVTVNDETDADAGPNGLQNVPAISSAELYGSAVIVSGFLETTAGVASYEIEFFSSPNADPSGRGEGKHYLGNALVTTDPGGNASFVVLLFLPGEPAHWITATATDAPGNTSEFSVAALAAPGAPPMITDQPDNASAPPGGNVMLCVTATGSQPLSYQWRKNGVNLPGATNSCLTILGAQVADGGTYDVVVRNPFEAILSGAATVTITVPVLPPGDNLANRVALPGASGTVRGTNVNATRQPGEPMHAGKPGGASVWYSFTSASAGVMTIATSGSTFDTLLAVYTGTTIPALVELASDEESGGFLTSQVRFNVTPGVEYIIAVDGHGAAMGSFVLSWEFQISAQLYPVITNQPVSATVPPGANHTFIAGVTGTGLTYQWFFNGNPVPGATTNFLTLTNVQEGSVGTYLLRVTQGVRTLDSRPVSLQINLTGPGAQPVQGTDKFLDADVLANPIVLGPAGGGFAPASVVRGYTGTQVFNTFGAVSVPGEPPVCGVPGGASTWLKLVAEQSGDLHVNTDGSSFNTVMAVYERIVGMTNLHYLGCDDTNGLDRLDSALVVPVVGGRTNFIVIDGLNAATGVLRFNYNLVVPSTLTALGRNQSGQFQFLVTGKPGMVFTIQSTADLRTWSNLFTGSNAAGSYLYTDTNTPAPGSRWYRLRMLP